jgi:hypothetical protein
VNAIGRSINGSSAGASLDVNTSGPGWGHLNIGIMAVSARQLAG